MRRALASMLLLMLVLPLTGCGAVMSTYLILVASSELDGAEAAEAEKFAPYEYTAATEYLHKAREEQGYADFGAAIEYAFKAQELAEKGKARAEKVKREQQPPPGVPTAPLDFDEGADDDDDDVPNQVIIRKIPEAGSESEGQTESPQIVPVAPETEPEEAEEQPEIMIVPIPTEPAPAPESAPESH